MADIMPLRYNLCIGIQNHNAEERGGFLPLCREKTKNKMSIYTLS